MMEESHRTGSVQELSRTAGQGVSANPDEDTTAKTLAMEMPFAVRTATGSPI